MIATDGMPKSLFSSFSKIQNPSWKVCHGGKPTPVAWAWETPSGDAPASLTLRRSPVAYGGKPAFSCRRRCANSTDLTACSTAVSFGGKHLDVLLAGSSLQLSAKSKMVLKLVLPVLFLLTTPAMAVEYQGKNIDGRKLDAKAYYSQTGGVYDVQVLFKRNRATIYFTDGSQTTIRLNHRVITDPNDIEGFGKLGQVPLNGIFSVGLNYDNNLVGNSQRSESLSLGNFFWRISLKQH